MKIISAIFVLVFFMGFMSFLGLSIDIVDGRTMGMKMSPYIGADTTNIALSIAIFFMIMSLLALFLTLYMWKENSKSKITSE